MRTSRALSTLFKNNDDIVMTYMGNNFTKKICYQDLGDLIHTELSNAVGLEVKLQEDFSLVKQESYPSCQKNA